MCVYPRTHTRTQTRTRLPCWPRSPQGSVLGLLERKEPSLAPARPPARRCSCRLRVELGRLQCERSRFPATLRVKSILHKQEQRAGRETMNNTSEEEQASRGGGAGEGNSKVPALPSDQGMEGQCHRLPFGREHWGGSEQESPAPPQPEAFSPKSPAPITARTKGL